MLADLFDYYLLSRFSKIFRYYIADGVRIYSQESWRRIVKDNGRMLVKKYISHFVSKLFKNQFTKWL